jgi:hypothetical protein
MKTLFEKICMKQKFHDVEFSICGDMLVLKLWEVLYFQIREAQPIVGCGVNLNQTQAHKQVHGSILH